MQRRTPQVNISSFQSHYVPIYSIQYNKFHHVRLETDTNPILPYQFTLGYSLVPTISVH